MLSPYENVIIGNFIYGLGLVMGKNPRQIDSCVNLLQQTPLDKVLVTSCCSSLELGG